jgi:release factor glutamine methyltransferase
MSSVKVPHDAESLTALLESAGFVAAPEEATELVTYAAGDTDLLDSIVARRLRGEPFAWITGKVRFCGLLIQIDPDVYVPRWQSEGLARRAGERLPPDGVAVDLCTGSGALAAVLRARHPRARVVATDVDQRAVDCATANGIEVFRGDLFAPLPESLVGHVDLVVGVVPYVPTPALRLLPPDTLAFESPVSYDGGPDGVDILRRAVADARRFLRPGGALLLELGGDQAEQLAEDLSRLGYVNITVHLDEDGDTRGIEATFVTAP